MIVLYNGLRYKLLTHNRTSVKYSITNRPLTLIWIFPLNAEDDPIEVPYGELTLVEV